MVRVGYTAAWSGSRINADVKVLNPPIDRSVGL
jgi:hypothetical protein